MRNVREMRGAGRELGRYLREDAASMRGALQRTTALNGMNFDLLPFDQWAFEAFRAGMLRHVKAFDQLVLPALAEDRGAPLPAAGEVRVVHDALATLLAGLPTLPLIGELRGLFELHDRIEAEVLGCCDELPPDASAALLADLRALPEAAPGERYDGPGPTLTAAEALAAARRQEAARRSVPVWYRA